MANNKLEAFLNQKVDEYNQPSFIFPDPVSIPHRFSKKQDIEIAGFLAATFAWGNRTTIIQKCTDLLTRMDDSPYEFCLRHQPRDLQRLTGFKHRTFNDTDLLYFISFFNYHYSHHDTLESAFTKNGTTVEQMLCGFHQYFFSLEDVPSRSRKHVASPAHGSTCKRLNMFLRWMVRKDNKGVDFGIWDSISPAQLICPIDLHAERIARRFGLLKRKQLDWKAAIELTQALQKFDPADPVKYDYALFGIGVMERLEHK